MKKTIVAACAALAMASTAQASSWDQLETSPSLYMSVPLGAQTRADSHTTFGLAVGQVEKPLLPRLHTPMFTDNRPKLADLQLRNGRVEALNVNGVNTLSYTTVYNANGESSTQYEVRWPYFLAGAIAIGLGIYIISDEDDEPNRGPILTALENSFGGIGEGQILSALIAAGLIGGGLGGGDMAAVAGASVR